MNSDFNAYEVIRIINSKPLFLYDHFLRLENTLQYSSNTLKFSETEFVELLSKTVRDNNIENGNVRIDAYYKYDKLNYVGKQILHVYPTEEQYRSGVETCTIKRVRVNPNDKIWDGNLRLEVNEIIKQKQVYETLYIDNNNCLTEGSRSNLFFLKGNELFSAPSKKILLGITRKYVIEAAKNCDLKFVENDIPSERITNFDAAFISGTSYNVLPIRNIDNIEFNVNNSNLRNLMLEFNNIIIKHLNK